jgi:hypothetical protein
VTDAQANQIITLIDNGSREIQLIFKQYEQHRDVHVLIESLRLASSEAEEVGDDENDGSDNGEDEEDNDDDEDSNERGDEDYDELDEVWLCVSCLLLTMSPGRKRQHRDEVLEHHPRNESVSS